MKESEGALFHLDFADDRRFAAQTLIGTFRKREARRTEIALSKKKTAPCGAI